MLKGDFIGFQFNGKHSSDMGIVRTSNGSRYNDILLPTFQDKTVVAPGSNETYYFGSQYTQKPFSISFATDSLTESQYRQLRAWLGDKQIHDLIFDETPYKIYSVKTSGSPTFNFICFEEEGKRIYKGEGSINFVAYYPFARSRFKYLNKYADENKKEWNAAAGLLEEQGTYDGKGEEINLYNPGDLKTDFLAYYSSDSILTSINIGSSFLYFNAIQKKGSDVYYRINSKTNLVEGCNNNFELTGTLYNEHITKGNFFKIPLGESIFTSTGAACEKIEYDYLYY